MFGYDHGEEHLIEKEDREAMRAAFGKRHVIFGAALVVLLVLVVIYGAGVSCGHRAVQREAVTRAVLNEAANQGIVGMTAHAVMFKNRLDAGMSLGSAGVDSPRVRQRIAAESKATKFCAREAVRRAFDDYEHWEDLVAGALYCENVKDFGVPDYIAKGILDGRIEEAANVGDVTFWRPKNKS